jgi:hypothetical protein
MSKLSAPHQMVRKYLWVTGVEKQTLGIPFRTIPRKRTQLGILFRVTKNINNLPNHSVEEKPTQQNAAAKYFKNSVRKDNF